MEYKTSKDLAKLYETKKETKALFKGLSLLEVKAFDGGTSIKYWM